MRKLSKHKFAIAVIIIVILLLVLGWLFLVKPQIDKFIVDKQLEGYDIALASIQQVIAQQGYAQFPSSDGNNIVCQVVEA